MTVTTRITSAAGDPLGAAWGWVNDSAGALGAVATIVTAVFAVLTLVHAGRDSRDRTRPYVLAEFRLAEHSDSAFDLVIRNAGTSMARQVAVTFDPVPQVPEAGGPFVTPFMLARYNDAIPCVAPSQTLKNVWWTGRQGAGNLLQNAEPTPDEVTVGIAYEDDRGRKYQDTFPLDVRVLLNTTTSTSSTSIKGRLKTINESLAKASNALVTLSKIAQSEDHRRAAEVQRQLDEAQEQQVETAGH